VRGSNVPHLPGDGSNIILLPDHNYGHGQQTLSMVFYMLNLLAFLAHKVLEWGDRLYQQCREGESRRGLWTLLRSAFYYAAVESWEGLLLYHLSDESQSP
jgi:hypothetical protein